MVFLPFLLFYITLKDRKNYLFDYQTVIELLLPRFFGFIICEVPRISGRKEGKEIILVNDL